jgi:hypothetical protein
MLTISAEKRVATGIPQPRGILSETLYNSMFLKNKIIEMFPFARAIA